MATVLKCTIYGGCQPAEGHHRESDTKPSHRKIYRAAFQIRQHKGLTLDQARKQVLEPLTFAALKVLSGDADGIVAGAINTTAAVVKTALQLIGMRPQSELVSSFFLMQHNLPHHALQGTAIYADCALVIEPNATQLADIAITSADSAKIWLGWSRK